MFSALPGGPADTEYLPGTQLPGRKGRGAGGAAGAQYQDFFTAEIQAGAEDQPGDAVQVRVISGKPAVPVDNGVYGTDGAGCFIDLIQEGDDCLLVGNGDVDSAEPAGRHEGRKFLRRQFLQVIGIAADLVVDLPGKTVGKMLTDAAIF